MRGGISINLWRGAIALLFLSLWEGLVRIGWIEPFYVGVPSKIILKTYAWVAGGFIFPHLYVTILETIAGFLLGATLGLAVALLFAFQRDLADLFQPIFVFINSFPRVVLYPLFAIWFGLGVASKIVLGVSLVFFVVFFNTYQGIREVERDILENVLLLGASRRGLIWHVYLPAALIWIMSGLRVSVSLALIGAVVGEYVASAKGVGQVIAFSLSMFRATEVMAGLLILVLVITIIDYSLRLAEARFTRWRGAA